MWVIFSEWELSEEEEEDGRENLGCWRRKDACEERKRDELEQTEEFSETINRLTPSQILLEEPLAISPISSTCPPTQAVQTFPDSVSATRKLLPLAILTIFSSEGRGSSTKKFVSSEVEVLI